MLERERWQSSGFCFGELLIDLGRAEDKRRRALHNVSTRGNLRSRKLLSPTLQRIELKLSS